MLLFVITVRDVPLQQQGAEQEPHLLTFPHCRGDHLDQPDPGSTWSHLNAFQCSSYRNTPKALCLIKCGAAVLFFFSLCYLPHCHATCVIFDPERGLTGCAMGRRSRTFVNWTVVFVLFSWTAQMFGRLDSLFEHGALLVGSTPRVWVGGVLHCVVVQVGDQGNWRWMTGRISGAALTVILVLSFHVCVRVFVWAATSPGTTSACNTHAGRYALRQQALHTPLCK